MLCSFSNDFPDYVARFMDMSHQMRRRFREDTMTEMMMASLTTAGMGRVIVDFSNNEAVTGADMEWNFVDQRQNSFFRVILQAKRIYGDGNIWTRLNYKELFHRPKKASDYQAVALSKTARSEPNTYPFYVFFNSQRACNLARKGNVHGSAHIDGVMLVDGHLIANKVQAGVASKSQVAVRSLKNLAPDMFPLTSLLCPPSLWRMSPFALSPGRLIYFAVSGSGRDIGVPMPPTPAEIRSRIKRLRSKWADMRDFPSLPDVGEEIPQDIQDIIERRGTRTGDSLATRSDRRRVVLLSSSTDDEEEHD